MSGSYWKNPGRTDKETTRLIEFLQDALYPSVGEPDFDKISFEPPAPEMTKTDFIKLMQDKLPDYKHNYYPDKELTDLCNANPIVARYDNIPFQDLIEKVNKGDARSMFELGDILWQGDKNIPQNPDTISYGIYLFHKSLLAGCKDSSCNLALLYYQGEQIDRNFEAAVLLNSISECPDAVGELGVCYANGEGVKRNRLKAYMLFTQMLLLDPEANGYTYNNMTIIYPHLKRFEKDQGFIEYCKKKSRKLLAKKDH